MTVYTIQGVRRVKARPDPRVAPPTPASLVNSKQYKSRVTLQIMINEQHQRN